TRRSSDLVNARQRRRKLPARVIHHPVQATVGLNNGLHRRLDRLLLANIASVGAGNAAVGLNLGFYRIDLLLLTTNESNPSAEGGQFVGGTTANSRTTTGHNK